jgi:hypothetical protein
MLFVRLLIFMVLSLSPVLAFAQTGDIETARQEFALGNAAYGEGEYESAIRHFRLANREVPNARLLEYIGRCYVNLGRLTDAVEAYTEYAATSEDAAAEVAEVMTDLRLAVTENAMIDAGQEVASALARALGEQPRPRNTMRTQFDSVVRDVQVQIRSNPRGAQVFVDSVELGAIGQTPLDTIMFAGPAYVEVRLPNYAPQGRLVSITPVGRGESIPVITFNLEPLTVETTITLNPATASAVYVARDGDTRNLGIGGWSGELPAGPASFLLQQAGRARTIELDVQPTESGTPLVIALAFEDAPPPTTSFAIGTLIVVSTADDADVKVDGRSIGQTPGEFSVDLTPGTHTLTLSADRRCTWSQDVEITADTEARVYTPPELERGRCR